MRVLFATVPWPTHYFGLVPIAWALQTQGHEVRVASHPSHLATVAQSGLPGVELGYQMTWLPVFSKRKPVYTAVYTRTAANINQPRDLEGKKVADTAFSAVPKLFDAYAKAADIDASKVTWLVAAADTLPVARIATEEFVSGRFDWVFLVYAQFVSTAEKSRVVRLPAKSLAPIWTV